MFAEERKVKILEIVNSNYRIEVSDLTEELQVSESTIRRDLQDLEQAGLLKRTHGGAVKLETTSFEPTMDEKELVNIEEKMEIGKKAAAFIQDNDTIILDAGTTTLQIAKNIQAKNVTVLTNSILIALALSKNKDVDVVVTGGHIRKEILSIVGPITDRIIGQFSVDKAFIGANGITIKEGCTTPNIEEAHTKNRMIQSAKEVYVVADHSKFGKVSFARIAAIDEIDGIITSKGIERSIIEQYKSKNIRLIYN
ncbi:DeoR/GlpR family DNA-binding transcription regulator [Clostridium formicaceticum]|uniref:DeoR family transcriptional regulator n=1 Tax=Clostridium formicaceticum TaxID=1497 RepID=A0AAC9RKK2_9CLOT|nr:DeoR/GlpR family DNA-binding transcription regulator [Clostridium formicaceticum]AOY76569.1 DeoR family transcriptional regulator [Clostridium formicaceticum]ARE86988.1 Glucitol operon repressor [Clostridium formicaceticum]